MLVAANAYAGVGALMLQVDALLVNHEDLRAYAYGEVGLPPAGTRERSRAFAAAEIMFDVLDVYSQQECLLSDGPAETWRAFACDLYSESETIRAFWAERRHWYPEELRRALKEVEVKCSQRGDGGAIEQPSG